MAEERTQQRRLAAIMAADVVGYSRLMEQDEAGTLAMLKERRRGILTPLVAQHEGRIVKLMGDGVLVEFASAVNSVACAVELQKRMAAANECVPKDRSIALRIGINLGDVIIESGDLYGDSVNIAARLQEIAEPNGICITSGVHDQVEKKLTLAYEDLGTREIKNLARPVRVFRVASGNTSVLAGSDSGLSLRPSIAVLPFTNLSGDPEQQYFSDGITEDIITELSRFHGLFVNARNSSFQYRDKAIDVRRVGRELGVQYVVEGSVRKIGNRVRVTAQLVDARSGNHLWAERYDRTLDDIFVVQDEVVRKIAARLEGQLSMKVAELARRKPTRSMAAYECVLQAREHLGTFDWSSAEPLLRQAIELDPGYAQAHAWLAKSIVYRFFFEIRTELLNEALDHAQRGVGLDETDAVCHVALGVTYLFQRQFERAGVHYDRALALNPADVFALAHRCRWLSAMGQQEEALAGLDEVLLREPFPPSWYWEARSIALFAARRYRDAIEAIGRMSRLHYYNHAILAACHAQLGQMEEARAEVAEALRLRPDYTITRIMLSEPYKNPADAESEIEALRKAGLPE